MGPGIVRRGEAWEPPGGTGGVPRLCLRLVTLLDEAGGEPSARLLQVALWVGSHSLEKRFLLLFLAWARSDSIEDIRRLIGAPSTEAVRHRFRRLSDSIEDLIAGELALLLSASDRSRMAAALEQEGPLCPKKQMAGELVPLVLLPRYSSYVGQSTFSTIGMEVTDYSAAIVNVWRGKLTGTTPTFGVTFEESMDQTTWTTCTGTTANSDPGQETEAQYTAELTKRWFRIKVTLGGTNPAGTCWAIGFLELRER